MRAEDIIASICQYRVKITDNIITDEFFAFGKIGYDAIHPMMDQEGPTINFEDIAGFSSETLGAHNLHLWVDVINKGKIELFRSEYLPGKKYTGFRYNDKGMRLMPNSVADLDNIWPLILPDFNSKCWREDTDGHLLIDKSLIGESGIGVINDATLTRISIVIQNKLHEFGCVGTAPSSKLIGEVLTAKADMNHHNKFIEMMKKVVWDREPRLDRVFIDVLGGKMRGLTREESEKALIDLTRNWFLGAVRRQLFAPSLTTYPSSSGHKASGRRLQSSGLPGIPSSAARFSQCSASPGRWSSINCFPRVRASAAVEGRTGSF